MTKIVGIIPARYDSSRFPGKPLAMLGDKSMIERVYQQASASELLSKVVVATDDDRIYQHVSAFGGQAVMTNKQHKSGTDRCQEAYEKLGETFDYVVNIQGDEPFIEPKNIDLLCQMCKAETQIATLAVDIEESDEIFDPNVVKVVRGLDWQALYFSRQAIPYQRNTPKDEWGEKYDYAKHIGIYAYRSDVLEEISALMPTILEELEALEQLRWLQNGYKILVALCEYNSIGIDTPEDLAKAQNFINQQNG